jgi:hypothetical protein
VEASFQHRDEAAEVSFAVAVVAAVGVVADAAAVAVD